MARLSLCMIVKNEAEFLEACLRSVARVVDEMIVVDTGSTDGTAEIARSAGATVVDFPWIEDFSAARNAALAAATGDFVLVLDADEQLARGGEFALAAACERDDLDVGLLPLHNASRLDADEAAILAGEARLHEPTLLPRLLRRLPDLRYRGVVHESLADFVAPRVHRVHAVQAPLLHFGSVPEVRDRRGKSARNTSLLIRRCEEEPLNPIPRAYLVGELLLDGKVAQARPIAAESWRLLIDARARGERPAVVKIATLEAEFRLAEGDLLGAQSVLDQVASWGTIHPNLSFLDGRVKEVRAASEAERRRLLLSQAALAYHRCVSTRGTVFPEETLSDVTGWIGSFRLGVCLTLLGEAGGAIEALEQALALREVPEVRVALAEAHLRADDPARALAVVEPAMSAAKGDAWILAAVACSMLERLEDADAMASEARAREASGWYDPARVALLAGVERSLAPSREQGRRLRALTERTPLPVGEDVGPAADPAMVIAYVSRVAADDLSRLSGLLTPRAEQVLPGVGAVLHAILAEAGADVADDGEVEPIFVGGPDAALISDFTARLARHPRIGAGPAAGLVPAIFDLRDAWRDRVDDDRLNRAVRAFVDAFWRDLSDKPRAIDQSAGALGRITDLGAMFPHARFVWIAPAGDPLRVGVIAAARTQALSLLDLSAEQVRRNPDLAERAVLAFVGEAFIEPASVG